MLNPSNQRLVDYLRQSGQARTDEVFQGVVYWTDEQLEVLIAEAGGYQTYNLGSTPDPTTFVIKLPATIKLRDDYRVLDSNEAWLQTPSTYNIVEQTLVFETAPSGAVRVFGYGVNMTGALVALWNEKAVQRSNYVDFTGGHNHMAMSQEYDHCIKMRDYYRNRLLGSGKRQRP